MKWLLRRIERPFTILVLGAVALYPVLNLVLWATGVFTGPRLNDFSAYYDAANRFIDGYPLYDHVSHSTFVNRYAPWDMPYLYPPIVVLLFLPFALLPFTTAGILWNIFSFGVLYAGVRELLQGLNIDVGIKRSTFILWLVLGFSPTITWMKLGQISGLLAGALCFGAAYAEKTRERSDISARHDFFSGVWRAIPVLVKPFYAPSGADFLRNQRRLLGALTSGFIVLVASFAIFGIQPHLDYLTVLAGGKGWGTTAPPNEWNATQFNPFYGLRLTAHIMRIALILSVIWMTIATRRIRSATVDQLVMAMGFVVVPITYPSTNTLALNALIPAFLLLFAVEWRRNRNFTVILLSLLLIQIHPYTIEFLAKFGPRYLPAIENFSTLIPYLQPATWGVWILFGWTMWRLYSLTHLRSTLQDSPTMND